MYTVLTAYQDENLRTRREDSKKNKILKKKLSSGCGCPGAGARAGARAQAPGRGRPGALGPAPHASAGNAGAQACAGARAHAGTRAFAGVHIARPCTCRRAGARRDTQACGCA